VHDLGAAPPRQSRDGRQPLGAAAAEVRIQQLAQGFLSP
jgi:hypothetical protein